MRGKAVIVVNNNQRIVEGNMKKITIGSDINDIINNDYFKDRVRLAVNVLREKRNNRPSLPASLHYKRDWYDRMREDDLLNSTSFVLHIKAVWLKQSTLSSECRSIILHVCNKALLETIEYFKSMPDEKDSL